MCLKHFKSRANFLRITFIPLVLTGKDRIIFVTKEDHEAPSNAELIADDPNDPYEDHGEYRFPHSL